MLSFVRDPAQGKRQLKQSVDVTDMPLTDGLLALQTPEERIALIELRMTEEGSSVVEKANNYFKRQITITKSKLANQQDQCDLQLKLRDLESIQQLVCRYLSETHQSLDASKQLNRLC